MGVTVCERAPTSAASDRYCDPRPSRNDAPTRERSRLTLGAYHHGQVFRTSLMSPGQSTCPAPPPSRSKGPAPGCACHRPSRVYRAGSRTDNGRDETRITGCSATCWFLVGVAGFEPAASSSRSQVAARVTSAAARGLRQTVRGCPLTSAVGRGDCHSVVVRAQTAGGLTAAVTAAMAVQVDRCTGARASKRARSYHASPGGAKASVLRQ
jgi:hypothetical protein